MTMHALLLSIALCLAPVWASALGYACTFTKSCVEDKSCQPSGLEVAIQVGADKSITLNTGGRSMAAQMFLDPSREARAYVTRMEYNTIQMMTIFADGAARFTQHTPVQDLQSLTHHGHCKETP